MLPAGTVWSAIPDILPNLSKPSRARQGLLMLEKEPRRYTLTAGKDLESIGVNRRAFENKSHLDNVDKGGGGSQLWYKRIRSE